MKPFIDTVDISVRYKPLTPKPFIPKTGEIALRKYFNKARIFKRNSQSKIFLQPSLKKKLRQRFLTQEKNPFKKKYLTPLLRAADDEERVQAYRDQLLKKKYSTENIDPRLLRMDSEIDDFMKQYKIPEPNKLFSLPEHIEPQIDYGKASDLLQKFGKDVFVSTDVRPPALVDTYYETFFKKTPEVPPNTPFVLEKTVTTNPGDVVIDIGNILPQNHPSSRRPTKQQKELPSLLSTLPDDKYPPLRERNPTLRSENVTEYLKKLALEIDNRLYTGQYKNKKRLESDLRELAAIALIRLPPLAKPSISRTDFFDWWFDNSQNKDNPRAMKDLEEIINENFGEERTDFEPYWPLI